MSLRAPASSAVVVVVAACLLCAAWALGSLHVFGAPGPADGVTAVAHGDLEGPAEPESLGAEADPEDADSMPAARDVPANVTSVSVHLISTERSRSVRPDRPPRPAHLG
jgi:hypothetical protein